MNISPEVLEFLKVIVGPTGAVWLSAKMALNGTKERVKNIETKVDRIIEGRSEDSKKIAVLEERTRHLENP